ncbi:MAG TPA: aldehyde dehydrogenase family protein, partial [Streptosporangiaceae bacterium]|nr:aldehyde dehydrogenase family protein [Streptosporangiaceae bacterium]
FAGGTAVFPQWQGQDDRVCSFGGIGSGGRGRRVSREIQVGTVWTNTWAAINDGFAEGGYKQSGIGRLRGPLAITDFQEAKTVVHSIPPFQG